MAFDPDDRKACTRCGVPLHVPDPPHVCADVQRRYDRADRMARAVVDLLADSWDDNLLTPDGFREVAERVVARLNRMGVTE
jgi:hypothetical protein